MAKIDYPQELTQAWWNQRKPTLAKTKTTGIGEALNTLEKAHADIKWTNFDAHNAINNVDTKLGRLPKLCDEIIDPVVQMAKDVEKLARRWAGEFSNSRLIPKSAAAAANAVADAAKRYIAKMADFEGTQAKELVALRKRLVATIAMTLKPSWTKTKSKVDGLLVDIRTYCNNPTEEQFWKLFGGDGNARGYTTGCKNWDQYLSEFPELRNQCFNGKAMQTFFPAIEDYGANWSKIDFERNVNPKTGKTGSECYIWHAKHLIRQVQTVTRFRDVVAKLLTLLN
jgi:hypothetical protein